MPPKVSIIVPIFNLNKSINYCVNSILNQTYNDFEIILVNDGSTDNSLDICKELAKQDNRVRVISQDNKGVSAARNAGLENANGKYIAFVDGDDIIAPFYIEKLVEACNNRIFSMCMYEQIYNYNHSFIDSRMPFKELTTDECACRILKGNFAIGVWASIYLRESIGSLRFPDGIRNNEDKYFLFQFLLNNPKQHIVFTNEKMYGYLCRDESASRRGWNGSRDIIYVADAMYDMVTNHNPEWEMSARANRIRARLNTLKSIIRSDNNALNNKRVFNDIKKEILSLDVPKCSEITMVIEYNALKLGNPFYILLVHTYYWVMNEKQRSRRNERRITNN